MGRFEAACRRWVRLEDALSASRDVPIGATKTEARVTSDMGVWFRKDIGCVSVGYQPSREGGSRFSTLSGRILAYESCPRLSV